MVHMFLSIACLQFRCRPALPACLTSVRLSTAAATAASRCASPASSPSHISPACRHPSPPTYYLLLCCVALQEPSAGDAGEDGGVVEPHFKREVAETYLRCVKEHISHDNVVIELNGLKIAEDRTFADCARWEGSQEPLMRVM